MLAARRTGTKSQIIVVCGYGCNPNPDWMRHQYLWKVVEYCFNNPTTVRWIITSGGFSQKRTWPKWSEAAIMKEFLDGRIPRSITVTEEDKSLTTPENLKNTKEMVRSWEASTREKPQIIIFCDAIRALRVKLIAQRVFKNYDVRIETRDLSSPENAEKQLLACIVDLTAYYFPPLASLRRRVKEWQAKRA